LLQPRPHISPAQVLVELLLELFQYCTSTNFLGLQSHPLILSV
jgi:hypothetical protein